MKWQDLARVLLPDTGRECADCGKFKLWKEFAPTKASNTGYHSYCIECKREHYFKQKYGITTQQYNDMLDAQNGVCAICGEKETTINGKDSKVRPLAVGV